MVDATSSIEGKKSNRERHAKQLTSETNQHGIGSQQHPALIIDDGNIVPGQLDDS